MAMFNKCHNKTYNGKTNLSIKHHITLWDLLLFFTMVCVPNNHKSVLITFTYLSTTKN